MFNMSITPEDAFIIRAFLIIGIFSFFINAIADIKYLLENNNER